MFEVIFVWWSAQEKHRDAPLRYERERFLNYLQDQGCSRYLLVTTANIPFHIVSVRGLTSMSPVSEVEILQAAAQWAEDKQNHLKRPPGPGL
jgi:hypothetical protein